MTVETTEAAKAAEPRVRRVLIADLGAHLGEAVHVRGWLHAIRSLGRTNFVILRDGSGLIQIVTPAERLAQLGPLESSVAVEALVSADPRAPLGVELTEPRFAMLAPASGPPLIDLTKPHLPGGLPFLLDHASVALRHPTRREAARLSSALVRGFRSELEALGFQEVFTPKILGTATEGGAHVFPLDYFGRPAFLAQSPQFYKQMLVGAFERVYEVGPVFRAEPHDTARHLSQYTSLDAELGFIDSWRDVAAVLAHVMAAMMASAHTAVPSVAVPAVPETLPMVHFQDALQLAGRGLGENLDGEPDLAPAHERWLSEWAAREHGSDFLLVVGYPLAHRPFYTHPDPEHPGCSASFDLLFRGQEIVTGGQRLHRYTDYLAALAARGFDAAPYQSYLEAFRTGMPAHGGFAIGLERVVQKILGAANIREVCLFPRDVHRLQP